MCNFPNAGLWKGPSEIIGKVEDKVDDENDAGQDVEAKEGEVKIEILLTIIVCSLILLIQIFVIAQVKLACICREKGHTERADLEMAHAVTKDGRDNTPTKYINPMKQVSTAVPVIVAKKVETVGNNEKLQGNIAKSEGSATAKKVVWKSFTDSNGNEYYSDGSRSTWTDRRTKEDKEAEKSPAKGGAKKASDDGGSGKKWTAIHDKKSGHV